MDSRKISVKNDGDSVSEQTPKSPLDVLSIEARVSTEELIAIVHKQRKRTRGIKI